nr:hypothetical protein [Tanacetum cinerariifolium]
DEEEVSSDNEETKVKALMVLIDEEIISISKESARNDEWIKITKNFCWQRKCQKRNLHKSFEAEDSTLPNHDIDEAPSNKLQRNSTDPSAVIFDSLRPDYDSVDESLVCSTPHLLLKKLDGAEPGSGPKTVNLPQDPDPQDP